MDFRSKQLRGLTAVAFTLLGVSIGAQAQAPADPYSYSRTTNYTYQANGWLQTETVEPDNLPSCVLTTYTYDGWGNRQDKTVANCAGSVPTRQQFTSRTTSSGYVPPAQVLPGPAVPSGVYPLTSTNALGQMSARNYDAGFGVLTHERDANDLLTTRTLDIFGRVTRVTAPDATSVVTQYCYIPGRVTGTSSNSASCAAAALPDAPADAAMYVQTEPRDSSDAKMGPFTRVYTDRLGRTLRTVTESFDASTQPTAVRGQLIVKDTVYAPNGAKVLETQPYFLATGSSTATGSQDVGATLTQYDALGRPSTIYTADAVGLAGTQVFGGSGTVSFGSYGSKVASKVSYAYAGLVATITNDKGQQRIEERNAIGMLVRITDPAGGQLVHQHDAFGNLTATKDALQNSIALKYDILGRKLELNDPDAGLWKYDYDALGQLVWQENANQRAASTSTTMAYDKLGRMIGRTEPEGTGTWTYDQYTSGSGCSKGVGRLCESKFVRAGTADTRANKTYFDSLGRAISDVTTVTNGPTMATARSYDGQTGRLDTKTFPTGVKVQYGYSAMGFAHQLKLLTPATVTPLPATPGGSAGSATSMPAGTVLWQARIVSAWGSVSDQLYGNGLVGRTGSDAATGRVTLQQTGSETTSTVVNHAYTWDSLNNLVYKADAIGDAVAGAVTETFEYTDSLSRLTKYTVAAPGVPSGSRSVTLQYNALGMLLNKSDVGVYTYNANGAGAVRPHALATMTPVDGSGVVTYGYDGNGNLTSADQGKYRTLAYTSFNLPDGQNGIGGPSGSPRYTWVYDENHQRIKEVRTIASGAMAGTRTTWMLHPDNAGGLSFESEVNAPTSPSTANPAGTSNRHYISFGGKTIGVLVTTGNLPTVTGTAPPALASAAFVKVEYWHKDHLGSLVATTDAQGSVTARYAYDPFGKRRHTNGSYDAFGNVTVDWSMAVNSGTDRGYTEHEHLDDLGLIHMNGRIFDPTLGRFLQTDPRIQTAADLQNYNRYAYCLNNPLTCTDPSGLTAVAQDGWAIAAAHGFNVASIMTQMTSSWHGLSNLEYGVVDPFAMHNLMSTYSLAQALENASLNSSGRINASTGVGGTTGPGAIGADAGAVGAVVAGSTVTQIVITGYRASGLTTWFVRLGGATLLSTITTGPAAGIVVGTVGLVTIGPAAAGSAADLGTGANILNPDGALFNAINGDPYIYAVPPDNARDPNGPKAPGKPPAEVGFEDPKGGENWVPNPNSKGNSHGWQAANGDVWVPTGQGGLAHGGPHWDVQSPGGRYRNVYPPR